MIEEPRSRVNDHPRAGGLDLHASVVFPRPYGRGKQKARQCYKRCGCNPPQADLKTDNHLVLLALTPPQKGIKKGRAISALPGWINCLARQAA